MERSDGGIEHEKEVLGAVASLTHAGMHCMDDQPSQRARHMQRLDDRQSAAGFN